MTTVNLITHPPLSIKIKTEVINKGTILHRVHPEQYGADQFHPGVTGKARFSPIYDKHGNPIPTIYAAESLDAALMETVFHNVPFGTGLKTFYLKDIKQMVASTLTNINELELAVLYGPSMRKLGIPEAELIHTSPFFYEQTRLWAEAIHTQFPNVQGLVWQARQCSHKKAFMFFGDRVNGFAITQAPSSLVKKFYADVINQLAEDMDVILK